jgi:hypothetical protein
MLIFNLTIHNLWGHVLAKYPQARALAYADDGCINARMRVALQVLADLQHFLKEDAGLDLNISKTQRIIYHNSVLTPLNADVSLASFCPDGFIGIGVTIGTDVFVRNFVV